MKQFAVRHRLSAMKVGVDAVILGAWATPPLQGIILDAGCGCGILSLMLAQRSPSRVKIEAIDTDPLAIIEAKENFNNSPWAFRLSAHRADFTQISGRFSLIISNPPFFRSGVNAAASPRMTARHADSLSPLSLLLRANELLAPAGSLCMICPPSWLTEIQSNCRANHLYIKRLREVSGASGGEIIRLLVELSRNPDDAPMKPETSRLNVRNSNGAYTDEYRRLTADFYLNF